MDCVPPTFHSLRPISVHIRTLRSKLYAHMLILSNRHAQRNSFTVLKNILPGTKAPTNEPFLIYVFTCEVRDRVQNCVRTRIDYSYWGVDGIEPIPWVPTNKNYILYLLGTGTSSNLRTNVSQLYQRWSWSRCQLLRR